MPKNNIPTLKFKAADVRQFQNLFETLPGLRREIIIALNQRPVLPSQEYLKLEKRFKVWYEKAKMDWNSVDSKEVFELGKDINIFILKLNQFGIYITLEIKTLLIEIYTIFMLTYARTL